MQAWKSFKKGYKCLRKLLYGKAKILSINYRAIEYALNKYYEAR